MGLPPVARPYTSEEPTISTRTVRSERCTASSRLTTEAMLFCSTGIGLANDSPTEESAARWYTRSGLVSATTRCTDAASVRSETRTGSCSSRQLRTVPHHFVPRDARDLLALRKQPRGEMLADEATNASDEGAHSARSERS
jgi:hypothetical protein